VFIASLLILPSCVSHTPKHHEKPNNDVQEARKAYKDAVREARKDHRGEPREYREDMREARKNYNQEIRD